LKNENRIISIIKYAPIYFILILSFLTISFISYNHYEQLENEKAFYKKHYYDAEKTRIDELIDLIYAYIVSRESNQVNELKEQLKVNVNNAHSIMTSIYEENIDKKSKAEILENINDVLRNLKYYDGRGYYFIYDLNGNAILNSQFPNLEGKNLWNYQDSKGVYLLQEMCKILSEKDSTYFEWYWKKIDSNEHSKKLGYFKKFEPYNIFIGMGEYIEDFDESLKNEIIEYVKRLKSKNNEYIFLADENANVLATQNEVFMNTNFYTSKYVKISEEEKLKVEKIKTSKKPSTYIEYEIFNPETNEYEVKTTYIKWVDKWKFYIGTGFQNKNIDLLIEKRENELEKVYSENINKILFFSLLIVMGLMIVSLLISKKLENSFNRYKNNINKAKKKLIKAQEIALMGDWEYCLADKRMYWSKQIYKILNIDKKPKKFSKSFLSSILHEDDIEKFYKALEKTINDGVSDDNIYRMYDSQMNIKYLSVKSEKASDIKLIGVVQDITSTVKAQLEQKEQERIIFQQSKLAAMGEMIGNIAHQWRQPLSTISTVSTGVKVQKENNILNEDQLIEDMNTINNATQYLSQTIDDFRNFFEPKKDKLTVFDISDALDKTLKLVSAQFQHRNIRIHKDVLNINIESLENEIIQVLINILNNSKDALGNLTSNEKHIFIKIRDLDDKIKIEIYDNAGGIDTKIIDRVFEPYFTTKHKSQGTGIGLYMSKEIINNLLKGEITVNNYEFEYEEIKYTGAKFTLIFDKNGEKIN